MSQLVLHKICSGESVEGYKLLQWFKHHRKRHRVVPKPVARVVRSRLVYTRRDYKQSPWWMYVVPHPESTYHDLSTHDGKLFRRRFRVPYTFYKDLVETARPWFPTCTDAIGRECIPLELKILGVLRILGRGAIFDDVAEATFMSEETMRTFFYSFVHKFRCEMQKQWIHAPETEAEITSAMNEYSLAGFPGCIGSTDVVHIAWDRCCASKWNLYNGKEGFPTIAYEFTVNHKGVVQAVTTGFYGTCNDKTIVRFDTFIISIRNRTRYANVPYILYDIHGNPHIVYGCYILCDNGYHRWRCMQEPLLNPIYDNERLWSARAESLRKDVECVFGVMKCR